MIRKAILKSFDSTAYKATIQIDGSLSTYLKDVPVSRGIPAAEMTAGRTVALAFFNQTDPADAIVLGVF